ncbi:Colicin V secretion/processing ATP-binding protein CvaB [Seminavis robusta]|uniref:Colicin V secretion/processing ATP-binding protein CvaB n=1 Tax=Seminavis robusta TaxID=568900 RepID=A0A9N8HYX5_9STRA|nr:Colicin V secretion/processing ATP-binding protein CvaB [Seminavis robusta]|eukprot:Sro3104_g343850.1 Colicin V secretion/processing ATP-binding protein CvaB (888) ;mRNA; r:2506-6280
MSNEQANADSSEGGGTSPKNFHVWWLVGFFGFDAVVSIVLLLPWFPWIPQAEGLMSDHYTFWGSLADVGLLAAIRILCGLVSLVVSYERAQVRPEFQFDLRHPNGDKKSREELEMEALEEPFLPWIKRFISRPAFSCELFCLVTQFLSIAKCLARLDVEVGLYQDSKPSHPLFWITVALASFLSVVEMCYIDSMSQKAAGYGNQLLQNERPTFFRRVGSHLSIPLLSDDGQGNDEERINGTTNDEETATNGEEEQSANEVVGASDISGDAHYKAGWKDLLYMCYPDIQYIAVAFVFLLLAAVAQVYIPRFTGQILDALATAFSGKGDHGDKSIFDVPGFISNVKLLVLSSILCGLFSAIRGSMFTLVGGRVNVRLRVQLMDSLLTQDVGFFDTTKTGDITSRLSSDTTLVGDQVTLNVNVFLRSVVQAIALSKWYGQFLRSLTKLMQKKLADGNSISEAAIGSMPTVRAFDASEGELRLFEGFMRQYLDLNFRAAVAYLGYCTIVTALPYLVIAVIVFYGGLLIRNGDMSSGDLVSFILYLQSLSDAFASIGYIFSSLTQAVGAADKVFELMHRKPRYHVPTADGDTQEPVSSHGAGGITGITALKTTTHRKRGLCPESCRGEISLENVELFYPARPQRCVLNNLSMKVPPGSVVALVGSSGGGKSSVMSLVQHLYEPSKGRVLLDGHEVWELSPTWLSRHVSIVSQEPTLFGRSIKRNIIYGLEGSSREPTDEEIKEAARLANASAFIESMPLKYETEVGERGVQLSGGQKQRIAIARAIIRRPSVLLLDEATSALDSESEHMVQQAIDQMIARGREKDGADGGGMTVMIVAHRLSTVRNADTIFVVKDGQVVQVVSYGNDNSTRKTVLHSLLLLYYACIQNGRRG